MKASAWVLLIIIVAGLIGVAVWSGPTKSSGERTSVAPKQKTFVVWRSPDRYIAYLKATEPPDNPDLWRRIEAVKRMSEWPN